MSNTKTRGNDIAVEALKQLLTLSSIILAFTITFLKDALGDNRNAAIFSILIPISWLCLIVAIWYAWVALAEAGRTIAAQAAEEFVFDKGTSIQRKAKTAQVCFVAGLLLLGFFAALNSRLLFLPVSPSAAKSTTSSPEPTPTQLQTIQAPTSSATESTP